MNNKDSIKWIEHYRKPPKVNPIEETPFYYGSLNMVYGLSKSGKSRTLAELLVDANIHKSDKTVVWLDKDYNVDESTLILLSNFKHVNHNVDDLCSKLLELPSLNDYILIFDSLKDFSIYGLDSNADAQRSMESIRHYTQLGATVILIAHATIKFSEDAKEKGFKIQGNSETISSKCDCVFKFEVSKSDKHDITVRSFVPEKMRISNASVSKFFMYDKERVIEVIRDIIDHNEGITHRDLKKKFSSAISDLIDSVEGIAYTVEVSGNKRLVHKI